MDNFYAYVHARPNTSCQTGVFYVGKGRNKRANYLVRNSYHSKIVTKHGAENILIGKMECSSEDIAFDLEKGLIKCLKRNGVTLTNQTDGGDGTPGFLQSDSAKAKKSAAAKKQWADDNIRRKITLKAKERYASLSAEEKLNLNKKAVEATKSKVWTQEERDKAAARLKGKSRPDYVKAKISKTHKEKGISAEHKAKIIASNKSRVLTEEQKEKQKISNKKAADARWAKYRLEKGIAIV